MIMRYKFCKKKFISLKKMIPLLQIIIDKTQHGQDKRNYC